MSIASNRSRRPNAGAKMNDIANAKEDDEFYKKTYGGFVEEDNDNDFEPEGSDDEAVDGSIEENGESAEIDDKEHPPAKRLKTDAKADGEAESDDEDEDEDEDEDDDEDDDEEGEDEDDEEEEENGVEEDDLDGEGDEEDEDEADEDGDESIDADAKEKSKNAKPEVIPEESKAE